MPNLISIFLALCLILSSIPAIANDNKLAGDKQPIDITSDNLIIDQINNTATFVGNVDAIQADMHLHSDKMIAYYTNDTQKKDGQAWSINKIITLGNVILTNKNQKAYGDKGEYDMATEILELTGRVMLTKDGNILKGNKLVYHLKNGNSKIFSDNDQNQPKARVKAVLIPKNKPETVDKSQKD